MGQETENCLRDAAGETEWSLGAEAVVMEDFSFLHSRFLMPPSENEKSPTAGLRQRSPRWKTSGHFTWFAKEKEREKEDKKSDFPLPSSVLYSSS